MGIFEQKLRKVEAMVGVSRPMLLTIKNKPVDTANIFAPSCISLFSSVPSQSSDFVSVSNNVNYKLAAEAIKNRFVVSRDGVTNAGHRLNLGKKDGNSLLSSEFFINAPVEFYMLIYLRYLQPLFK
jgi:hypothetical protein